MTIAMPKHFRLSLVCLRLAAIYACLAGLAASPAHAGGETADFPVTSFIKEVIVAYGGEKALAGITSIYAKGSIETFMRGDRGVSTRYFKRPRKLRAELAYQKSSETRILNGFRGWRGSGGEPLREVHGPSYLAMAYQFKYLDLPFGFLDKGYKISYLGRENLRGGPVEVLLLADNEGTVMRVYIDAGTRLIAKVLGSFGAGPGGAELAAEFSDYRDVAGVKFPFRVTNYSGANKLADNLVTEIRINKEMPDALFQP